MTGHDVLETAISQLGTTEAPAGSNRVKYNTWYYEGREVSGDAYPWCMAFVQWCYSMVGAALPFKTASCGALLRWYQENDPECIATVEEAVPGCIVIFDLPGTKYTTDHTGIFESVGKKYITTIDGNTGMTNDANGGAVMRRFRPIEYVTAIIKPRSIWAEKTETEEKDVERYQTIEEIEQKQPWAAPTVRKLMDAGALNGDGVGLDLSRDMLREFVINDRMGLYM